MRVEITEKRLRDGGYNLSEGDTITVPADVGKAWCANGWARDTEGKVATGERRVIGAELEPAKARHTSKAKEV
jgi:hypothetical protein